MKSPLRILLLEGSVLDGDTILATLAGEDIPCQATRVTTRAEFQAALENNSFDLIVSDCSLPWFDGFAALDIAVEQRPGLPFILVSSTTGEELAIDTVKRGATDYVLKSHLARLGPAVRRAVSEATERAAKRDTVRSLAEREAVLRAFFDSPGAMRGVVEVIDNDIVHIADNAESAAFFGRAVRKNKLAGERKTLDLWIGCYAQCRKTGEPVRFN
jgi:DNA-binding NtrC family response regulator